MNNQTRPSPICTPGRITLTGKKVFITIPEVTVQPAVGRIIQDALDILDYWLSKIDGASIRTRELGKTDTRWTDRPAPKPRSFEEQTGWLTELRYGQEIPKPRSFEEQTGWLTELRYGQEIPKPPASAENDIWSEVVEVVNQQFEEKNKL